MTSHEHSVVVERPLMTVYDQWTQFESYPEFMDNVAEVRQVDAAMTHWKVSVAGVEREYDAQILEQRPGEVIAWQSVSGPRQAGRVRFVQLDPGRTRVTLSLDFEPHGVTENVGEAVGAEDRGAAEGGWRGEISDGVPMGGSASGGARGETDAPIDLRGQDANATPFGEPRGVRGF